MPRYAFTIRHGGHSGPSSALDCLDDEAAQAEAAGMFADVARDIAKDFRSKRDWQIEVANEGEMPIFRLSVLAQPLT